MARIAAWEFGDDAEFDGCKLFAEISPRPARGLRAGTIELTFTASRLHRATILAHGIPGRDSGAFTLVLTSTGAISLSCTDKTGAPFRIRTHNGLIAQGERVQVTLSSGLGGRLTVVNCDRLAATPKDPSTGFVEPLPLRARCDLNGRHDFTFGAAARGIAPFFSGRIHRVTLSDTVDEPTVAPASAEVHHIDFTEGRPISPRRIAPAGVTGLWPRARGGSYRRAGPSGMRVSTSEGDLPLARLQPGVEVLTRDNGFQPLRWVGKADLGWTALRRDPRLKPVVIRRDSFGPGLPETDLMLAPKQRVFVPGAALADDGEAAHGFVPACELLQDENLPNIEAIGATYVNFFCNRTEMVQMNGLWVEALNPFETGLNTAQSARREELQELHPALGKHGDSARG